jgi:hypothetical protein
MSGEDIIPNLRCWLPNYTALQLRRESCLSSLAWELLLSQLTNGWYYENCYRSFLKLISLYVRVKDSWVVGMVTLKVSSVLLLLCSPPADSDRWQPYSPPAASGPWQPYSPSPVACVLWQPCSPSPVAYVLWQPYSPVAASGPWQPN